jgi:hypothetical protein
MFTSKSMQAYFTVAVGAILIFVSAFTLTMFLGDKVAGVIF